MSLCVDDWTSLLSAECRFDFSLLASFLYLKLVPAAVFLLLLPLSYRAVLKQDVKVDQSGRSIILLAAKLASALLIVVGEVMAAAGWIATQKDESKSSVAAVLLTLTTSVCLLPSLKFRSLCLAGGHPARIFHALQVLPLRFATFRLFTCSDRNRGIDDAKLCSSRLFFRQETLHRWIQHGVHWQSLIAPS